LKGGVKNGTGLIVVIVYMGVWKEWSWNVGDGEVTEDLKQRYPDI
jgi:hypothetical protein